MTFSLAALKVAWQTDRQTDRQTERKREKAQHVFKGELHSELFPGQVGEKGREQQVVGAQSCMPHRVCLCVSARGRVTPWPQVPCRYVPLHYRGQEHSDWEILISCIPHWFSWGRERSGPTNGHFKTKRKLKRRKSIMMHLEFSFSLISLKGLLCFFCDSDTLVFFQFIFFTAGLM